MISVPGLWARDIQRCTPGQADCVVLTTFNQDAWLISNAHSETRKNSEPDERVHRRQARMMTLPFIRVKAMEDVVVDKFAPREDDNILRLRRSRLYTTKS
ncbi:hypothetical protein AcV5_009488 [Taiwanofungus camphoratus]|nr:hypothetical protein AcV5_009488 [Antrodia cinnamomea]